jgi:hypothetical protein
MSARRVLLLVAFAGLAPMFAPQARAQACGAERSAYEEIALAYYNSPLDLSASNTYLTRACLPADVEAHRGTPAAIRGQIPAIAAQRDEPGRNAKNRQAFDMRIKGLVYSACVIQAFLDRCGGAAAPASQPAQRPQPSAPAQTAAPVLHDPVGEAPEGRLGADPAAVARRVVSRQVAVDYRRGDKPKRHIPAAEAHKCLTVSKAGGFNNSCPFAVEFSFCTYRPKKDSWAAFFDCEKSKGGSWQVSANSRAAVHTDAEYVHWFACRYGPTLGKPDGVSPADVEYKRDGGPPGRLHGRCAQWGAGG